MTKTTTQTVRDFLAATLGVDPGRNIADQLYPVRGENRLRALNGVSCRFGGPEGQVGTMTMSYGGSPKATVCTPDEWTISLAMSEIPEFILDAPIVD